MAVETIDAARRVPPKEKMSFEEFLDWCDEDTWAEWVDGEVIMASPASMKHQDIGSLLESVLRIYVESHDLGKVVRAPFVMRMENLARGREPDLLFIQKERLHLIEDTYLNGAADMVVEIVSPESIGRDRGDKFVEYESAGVREYWLIDPDRRTAEFYELADDMRYRVAFVGDDGFYHSKAIEGFRLKAEWLWQEPLPAALEVLRELKIL